MPPRLRGKWALGITPRNFTWILKDNVGLVILLVRGLRAPLAELLHGTRKLAEPSDSIGTVPMICMASHGPPKPILSDPANPR